jgi:alpha-acetolactate decarboxylase
VRRAAAIAASTVALAAAGAMGAQQSVQAWGHFKRLMHTGDASAQVTLAQLPAGPGVYAVGAIAQMRGEVMIWDGRVVVSRGHHDDGRTEAARDGDEAALLALARVTRWQEVPVPRDMDQAEFEEFVVAQAKARGLDPARPFAFAVRGAALNLTWHVVTGQGAGAHGARHAMGHAAQHTFTAARADGVLLGFYSAESLEGVISHPGERFHVHWASPDLARSGHVDAYGVAAGATVLLPAAGP